MASSTRRAALSAGTSTRKRARSLDSQQPGMGSSTHYSTPGSGSSTRLPTPAVVIRRSFRESGPSAKRSPRSQLKERAQRTKSTQPRPTPVVSGMEIPDSDSITPADELAALNAAGSSLGIQEGLRSTPSQRPLPWDDDKSRQSTTSVNRSLLESQASNQPAPPIDEGSLYGKISADLFMIILFLGIRTNPLILYYVTRRFKTTITDS